MLFANNLHSVVLSIHDLGLNHKIATHNTNSAVQGPRAMIVAKDIRRVTYFKLSLSRIELKVGFRVGTTPHHILFSFFFFSNKQKILEIILV
jgi:hypothetical protein